MDHVRQTTIEALPKLKGWNSPACRSPGARRPSAGKKPFSSLAKASQQMLRLMHSQSKHGTFFPKKITDSWDFSIQPALARLLDDMVDTKVWSGEVWKIYRFLWPTNVLQETASNFRTWMRRTCKVQKKMACIKVGITSKDAMKFLESLSPYV